jgi:hypothetical protein
VLAEADSGGYTRSAQSVAEPFRPLDGADRVLAKRDAIESWSTQRRNRQTRAQQRCANSRVPTFSCARSRIDLAASRLPLVTKWTAPKSPSEERV